MIVPTVCVLLEVRHAPLTRAHRRPMGTAAAAAPPHKLGRPRQDDRRSLNAILWKLATGALWRDRPERYSPWQTVYTRFWRWTRAGVWDRMLAAVQRQADAAGQLDWETHFVDSTVVRAHQHAAGAKGEPAAEALGRSQGGVSTKGHLRAEGGGNPLTVVPPPGSATRRQCSRTCWSRGRSSGRAPAGGRRQRVHRPPAADLLPTAGDSVPHLAPAHRAPREPVGPCASPAAQSAGAADQPLQIVPQPGHPYDKRARSYRALWSDCVHDPLDQTGALKTGPKRPPRSFGPVGGDARRLVEVRLHAVK